MVIVVPRTPDNTESYIDSLFAGFDERAAARDVREAKARVAAGEAMLAAYRGWKEAAGLDS